MPLKIDVEKCLTDKRSKRSTLYFPETLEKILNEHLKETRRGLRAKNTFIIMAIIQKLEKEMDCNE